MELTWEDLLKKGIIEYLDAAEEDDCFIVIDEKDVTPEHTHLEIDKIDCFGASVSLIPFGNHDPQHVW
jgi:DNA-directed RNA polymerase subunit B'